MTHRLLLFLILAVLAGVLSALPGCNQFNTLSPGPMFHEAQQKAKYLGKEQCILCHELENKHWSHTLHARVFRGASEIPLADKGCEACHGPGSEHASDPINKTKIIAFTHTSESTVNQQNSMCLQCHSGENRLFWLGSMHQINDLSCSDCHNPMMKFSNQGLLSHQGINSTCFSCHQQQRADFRKRSHMPLPEGKMTCVDCHNPHGSNTDPLLQDVSVNQVCYRCHQEKRGPFIWEHAPVRENCLNCHQPHGSNHPFLLITSRPFLCQYCHTNRGHPNDLLTTANLAGTNNPDARLLNRSCQNCHVQIHGSNHPSGVRLHR